MNATFAGWDERTLELASDRVTVGLEPAQHEELRGRVRDEDFETFEFAAAAVSLAGLGRVEAPSAEFLRRLEADAQPQLERFRAGAGRSASQRPSPVLRFLPHLGWLAAAALLMAFVLRDGRGGIGTPSASASLGTLRAEATDLIELAWADSETPWGTGVTGEVVWSAGRQEGYMLFRGLEANDPGARQYQLWVFDTERVDWEQEPVDGGVFDVPRGVGDVVIPIDVKLEVGSAALFAVTLEEPGGVVVSRRERMVVTAAL